MNELELDTLRGLIIKPNYLELVEIEPRDFLSSLTCQAFQKIASIWEDLRPINGIDISLLINRMGGNGVGEFVGNLYVGQRNIISEIQFRELVFALKQRRITHEIRKVIEKQNRDDSFDPEELRAKYQELDQLKDISASRSSIKPVMKRLSEIEPKPISWLHQDRIAKGKINLIGGEQGAGKSYYCHDISARISAGREAPGSDAPFERGSVLLMSAEDGLADTVRVRADLLGADSSKIIVLDEVQEHNRFDCFSLSEHLPVLEDAIKSIPDLLLIVIDPVVLFMGEKANKGGDVRKVTTTLSKMAEKYNVAIILVLHLNRNETLQRALNRFGNSREWTGAARTVWLIDKDHEDESGERRLIIPVKLNICKMPPSLSFRITERGIEDYRIVEEKIDAGQFLSIQHDDKTAFRQACEWLKKTLSVGPSPSEDIESAGGSEGHKMATLRRAKKHLDIQSFSVGYGEGKKWFWKLP